MKILEVNNLVMHYKLAMGGWVRAVDDVSFSLNRGDGLGIVGESGCGKTSLGLSILRILPDNAEIKGGEIILDGINILRLPESRFRREIRWKRISMIFQGAMNALNPLYTVGEQIVEAIKLHEKCSNEEAWERARESLEMVGINPNRVNSYPFELSGGMRQRVVIAMALALKPEIVIADEPTTALDVLVQSRVLHLIKRLQEEFNLSLILISHDVSIIAQMVNHVGIMYAGKIVEYGNVENVFLNPRHPYTYALLKAVPDIKGKPRRLEGLSGAPPDLSNPPSGCRFHPRCKFAIEECKTMEPKLIPVGNEHFVACIRADEIESKLG